MAEECVLAIQFCCNPHFGVVYTEVAQNALVELEAYLARVAVVHPLSFGVIHGLTGVLILQLKRKYGYAVKDNHHIHGVLVVCGVVPLSVNLGNILCEQRCVCLVKTGFRLEIAYAEGNTPVLKAVTQYGDKPVAVAGVVEGSAELLFRVNRVLIDETRPLLWLRSLNEVNKRVHIKTERGIIGVLAFGVAAVRGEEGAFDVFLKALFGSNINTHVCSLPCHNQ